MEIKARFSLTVVFTQLILAAGLCVGSSAYSQESSTPPEPKSKEKLMAFHASGTFEVKLLPQPLADSGADSMLGRMTVDKTFSGDLQGTSNGEMLMAGTPVKDQRATWPSSA